MTKVLPFEVLVEPSGDCAEAETAEGIVYAATTLLNEARENGHGSPYARLYRDGRLVRDRVRRTDLATALGRCWCGRNALRRGYGEERFCCAAHEHLWNQWDDDLRARTIVAMFIHLHGGGERRS